MPEYKLRDKQEPGYNKLVSQLRHFLCFKQGTGKTPTTTKAIYDVGAKCVLIVCPKNAIRVWEDHLNEWIAGLDEASGKDTWYAIHRFKGKYNNTVKRREVFRRFDSTCHLNVYITTFAAFISDYEVICKHKYDCIVIDEAKRIRNRKSKAYLLLKPLAKAAKWIFPLTGTPGKTPGDFFTVFNLFDPSFFSSYWKFVGAFCHVIKNEWGQQEIIGLKNPDAWYRLLNNKCSFLTKEDLGHAETQRSLLHVDLDDDQMRLYKELDEDMMTLAVDNLIVAQTSMTKVLRFRQIMCCPAMLDPKCGVGAAFEDVVETIQNDADPFCVIFTPFTQAMPHWIKYLNAHGFTDIEVLHGGLEPDDMQSRIDRWRKRRNAPIICSILYATAFSLEPAAEAYFVGYEWDPEDNAQAEERLNRLTTKHLVNAYYYSYNGTYTQEHLQILSTKQRQANLTLGLTKI